MSLSIPKIYFKNSVKIHIYNFSLFLVLEKVRNLRLT